MTERVSKAEATQRAGRAGRVAAGHCYRMWARAEEGTMPAFAPPEIEISDLAPLALELAQWGSVPEDLAFLTAPSPGAWAQANSLLVQLGALSEGRLTPYGAALAKLPLHPRLAQMLLQAGPRAAPLAALLSDRDILSTQNCDLAPALTALRGPAGQKAQAGTIRDHSALERIKQEAKRLSRLAPKAIREGALSPAQCLALAYPERVAQRRPGTQPRYIMAGGKGAVLASDDTLANAQYLVIADLGNPHISTGPDPKIRRALALGEAELREVFAERITWETRCHWSKRHRRVIASRSETLGALSLHARGLARGTHRSTGSSYGGGRATHGLAPAKSRATFTSTRRGGANRTISRLLRCSPSRSRTRMAGALSDRDDHRARLEKF